MHRIFKKKGNPFARDTEGRARRPRRQRPGLEALEGRQLLSLGADDFLVNTSTVNTQALSDNASAANGLSVVVWSDTFSSTDRDIRAQLYNAQGQGQRRGNEIIVEFSDANQSNPKVAMDADGDFVVVYEETRSTGQTDIFAKLYDSNGAFKAGFGRIAIATSPKSERDADVAMDANGNFVVSYTEVFSEAPLDLDVIARQFNSSGALVGGVAIANSSGADESASSVAMSPDGRFAIAYQFQLDGVNEEDIILKRFSAGGFLPVPNGTHVIANSTARERGASVSMDDAGNAVVAYQKFVGSDFDIKAKRVSSLGAVGGEIKIRNKLAQELIPTVALSRTGGSFVVAYNTDLLGIPGNRTVEVAEVSASDAVGFVANLPGSPNNGEPALSIDASGRYQLSYTGGIGGNQNIFMRRGQLSVAPQAKNLALTESIRAGQSATLSGQLVDADGDTNLWLTVDWGDGSEPEQSQPGLEPFALKHRYARAGTYTVHVTWTDSTGLSNSWDLKLKVKKAK